MAEIGASYQQSSRNIDMTSLALSFNDVNFSPVEKDGQIWLTASELAKGLNYSDTRSVTKIFNRNAEEFSENMTQIIEIPEVVNLGTSNLIRKVRVFNSRGCHLIAMFARTDVAKAFRKWVLDVLDKVSGKPVVVAKTHKEERAPLTSAVSLLVAKTKHLNYSDAYTIVHQRFNVKHIDEIPYTDISVAVEYVHSLIALYSRTEKSSAVQQFPLKPQVLTIATQISHSWVQTERQSWFVEADPNGSLTINVLPQGYYPLNAIEFAKHFDGVLNALAGSELLRVGRYLLKEQNAKKKL